MYNSIREGKYKWL